MKTPLLALLLLAPLNPAALGCEKSDCPSTPTSLASKAIATPTAAKPAAPSAAPAAAPAAASRAEKPRRAPGSRLPAHLFM